jgi:hypothetical protein
MKINIRAARLAAVYITLLALFTVATASPVTASAIANTLLSNIYSNTSLSTSTSSSSWTPSVVFVTDTPQQSTVRSTVLITSGAYRNSTSSGTESTPLPTTPIVTTSPPTSSATSTGAGASPTLLQNGALGLTAGSGLRLMTTFAGLLVISVVVQGVMVQ